MEWDVDDRRDWRDFQDAARSERQQEARREARTEEASKTELLCGDCGFSWSAGWRPSIESVSRKLAQNPTRCPVCGSDRKARRG
jgi:rubrerythrin